MGVQRGRGNFKPRCPGRMDNWILILCRMSGKGEGIFLISFVWGGYGIVFGMILPTGLLVNVFLFCRAQNSAVQALPQHGRLKAIKNNRGCKVITL